MAIVLFLILLTFVYACFQGAPWLPTRKADIVRFLRLADIRSGQKMYDLGCGDGRLICAVADAGANSHGLELSLLPFSLACIRVFFSKSKSRVKVSYQNIWNTNISDADIIYVWLTPKVMPRLKIKFENELKKGAKIITYVWPIIDWQPLYTDISEGSPKLYLYQR